MPEVRVDMSPAAVARRLAAMAQLHRLGLSLRGARHLGPSRPAVAETGDPARHPHRLEQEPARRRMGVEDPPVLDRRDVPEDLGNGRPVDHESPHPRGS